MGPIKKKEPNRILLAVGLILSQGIQAADGTRYSLGAYYSSGEYGTNTTTEIESLSLGIRHKTGPWTYKINVPWLRIQGASNVLPNGQSTTGPSTSDKRSGLGDIIASVSRHLFYDGDRRVGMSLQGKVKLPTADEGEGLGTGEPDFTIELQPYALVEKTILFGALGFRKYGDTDTTNYNNVWLARAGFSYPVAENQSAGLMGSFRQKTRSGRDDRLSLMAFHSLKWTPGWTLQSYLIKGLTDTTADVAAGISLMKQY